MNTQERPSITIVTKDGMYSKDRTFRSAMPDWSISQKRPLFDESQIQLTAPNDESRPVYIAEGKARMDASWVSAICGISESMIEEATRVKSENGHVYLYADTVQFVHEPDGSLTIHEKPAGDPVVWAQTSPDAISQSGKTIEIVSALTGIYCDKNGVSEPKTVIVRVESTMRPFTREELVEYAKGSGNKTIPETAGGISLANGGRQFHDTSKPLIVSVQDSLDSTPKELLRYETWAHIPDGALRPFICGAFEPAVIQLVNKAKISK